MSVRVICPHCRTECLLAEQHLNVPVKCARCGKTFTVQRPAAQTAPPAPPKVAVTTPRLDVGSATSKGRVRDRNEDSFLVQHLTWNTLDGFHEVALVAVADGIGGHEAGNEASGIAIHTIGGTLAPLLAGALTGELIGVTPDILKSEVAASLKAANKAVYKRAKADTSRKGMGATAAVVLIWDGHVLIAHAGDCRVYHQHAGILTTVTRDHTLVARMIQLGQLSAKEAAVHAARNELTQAVGRHTELKPDVHHLQLTGGDWLIVACDGLTADLDEKALQTEMLKATHSAAQRARRLVDLANDKGGSDNCTVAAVSYQ